MNSALPRKMMSWLCLLLFSSRLTKVFGVDIFTLRIEDFSFIDEPAYGSKRFIVTGEVLTGEVQLYDLVEVVGADSTHEVTVEQIQLESNANGPIKVTSARMDETVSLVLAVTTLPLADVLVEEYLQIGQVVSTIGFFEPVMEISTDLPLPEGFPVTDFPELTVLNLGGEVKGKITSIEMPQHPGELGHIEILTESLIFMGPDGPINIVLGPLGTFNVERSP